MGMRHVDGAAMNAFHERYDLLVTPQMPTTAIAALASARAADAGGTATAAAVATGTAS